MYFHVTDVDSQTTYESDLSPSDVWRRVSSALKGDFHFVAAEVETVQTNLCSRLT
jgi:hypothetical protein